MGKLAIVGMSCIVPGATSPQEFYSNLLDGSDHRYDGGPAEFGFDPDEPGAWGDERHPVASRRGGFAPPITIDAHGYRLPADYLSGLDRSFQWALHVAREALSDAGVGIDAIEGDRTGLILGNYSFPTTASGEIALPLWHAGVTAGLRRAGVLTDGDEARPAPPASPDNLAAFGLPARVVGEALGLHGPQFALDAACSSALYSIKLAGDYLYAGRADLMLAGAVCAPDPALIHLSFSDLAAFPDNGISQPFDRRSTGIVTGQGAGMFAVKRLADAVADGDRIYTVVDGIGLSNDGGGRHLLSPNVDGQLRAYELAYQAAEVDPRSVYYVECHATGTPLGDATELEGLQRFFGGADVAPCIGSVKANLGHLLTVAGFSSVLKLIMAMHEGVLPRTPGVEEVIDGLGDFDVVATNRDWPTNGTSLRRAAASAFGFGGTNAHLVVSSHHADTETPAEPTSQPVGPALIAGMGCHVGPIADLADFERHVFEGVDALIPVPAGRWFGLGESAGLTADDVAPGAFCADLTIDPLQYRIPPTELTDFNSQHLLMLSVADQALTDAGIEVPSTDQPPRRVAVVIAMEMEPHSHGHRARLDIGRHLRAECARTNVSLSDEDMAKLESAVRDGVHEPIDAGQVTSYIGNIMASRISARYDFTGPSFTVAADGAGSAAALDVGTLLLTDPSIEAVLVGAVDLNGGLVAMAARGDRAAIGEGAAAVVLVRDDGTTRRAYARLDAIETSYQDGADESASAQSIGKALAAAGHPPQSVGLAETTALWDDGAELRGLASGLSAAASVCLTSLRPLIGDAGNVAGMLGVIKAALATYLGTFPPTPRCDASDGTLLAEDAPACFWAAHQARPWLSAQREDARVATVSMIGTRGSHSTAVVSSYDDGAPTVNPGDVRWPASGWLIAPVGGEDDSALLRNLRGVAASLSEGAAIGAVVGRLIHEHHPAARTAVLVATNAGGFVKELDAALRDLPGALAAGRDWTSPQGSFCTPNPVAAHGTKTALVYPGAFSAYPGAANDLFRLVPGLATSFIQSTDAPAEKFQSDRLYPRGRSTPSRRELMQLEGDLLDDIPSMLVAGTNIATLHTHLLRDALGVTVHGALGYSLGESSMLYALGVWDAADRDDGALRQSALFDDLLRGRKETVRRAWDIADDVPDREVWTSLLVLGDVEAVASKAAHVDRVFVTHVNSPTECVIAGHPPSCAALVDQLDAKSARTPTSHVMHCDLVRPHFDDLAALNHHTTHDVGDLQLFSAHDYALVPGVDGDELAHRIATTLCSTIDFPRLIHTAHDEGFRVFVDVGPSATCTRWIDEILSAEPHLTVAVDRRGMSAAAGLSRALAQLISHGVHVDLGALAPNRAGTPANHTVTVPTGGDSIVDRVERLAAAALDDQGPSASATQVDSSSQKDPAAHQDDADVMVSSAPIASPDALSDGHAAPDGLAFHGTAFVPATVAAAPAAPAATAPVPAAAATAAPPDEAQAREVGDLRTRVATPGAIPASRLQEEVNDELRRALLYAHQSVLQAEKAIISRGLDAVASPPDAVAPSHGKVAAASATGVSTPARAETPVAETTSGETAAVESSAETPAADEPTGPSGTSAIWHRADLVEFATGSIEKVFGPHFAAADEMAHRVRLPAPPYLFVDRVTALDAEVGRFERSTISTEFDIAPDAWFTVDGLAPPAVTIEAGQCDMLLISYLGIDLRNKGNRFYRLLDSTLVFHGDLPHAGQTLRYDITIDRFVWNGDMLLFFFKYLCYADGDLILELEDASAGFFTQQELDEGRGAVAPVAGDPPSRKTFKPIATSSVTRLSGADLAALAEGRRSDVFGEGHWQPDGTNVSLRLPDEQLRLIDEITNIDRTGGSRGLGQLSAITRLKPDGWYFTCHFVDDPVLAGSMIAEGAVQILQAYAMYLGMHLCLPDARFQSVIGLRTDVKVRGQVTPVTPSIRYEVDIDDLTLVPRPTVIAHITVYDGDKPIVSMRNFGVQLREKPGTDFRTGTGGVSPFLGRTVSGRKPALINEMHLAHAATGDLGVAMGPEFDVYHDHLGPHIPNGDFQFVDRIAELTGTRSDIQGGETMVTHYDAPADAWYFAENNAHVMPNCVVMETSLQAAILLGYYLGATLKKPEETYHIRNLDGSAQFVRDVDMRGGTIEHRITLLDSTDVPGSVLQRFRYELCTDGEPFYTGESLFGYFSGAALEGQLGLDGGKEVPPWIDEEDRSAHAQQVTADEYQKLLLTTPPVGAPHHLRLLDSAQIVTDGGNHGRGYVLGRRRITAGDWYFENHFYRDPVMPGSLGVEAIIHLVQLFALKTGATEHLSAPVFTCPLNEKMSWRYRGQLLREDPEMTVEAHVIDVRATEDGVVVTADAWLWKGGLRIYEVKNVAVEARSGDEG